MKNKFDWSNFWVLVLTSVLTLLIMWLLDVHGVTQKIYEVLETLK